MALERLTRRYGNVAPGKAEVVVALGGDGLMLRTVRKLMKSDTPIYGMHRGTVGFLMNEYEEKGLRERLAAAQTTVIHPLTDALARHQRPRAFASRDQRGLAVPPNLSGGPACASTSTARSGCRN